MSHNSYELAEKKLTDEFCISNLELKGRNYFSKYDIESLEKQITELKTSRYYIGAAFLVIGSFITVIVLHYT
jgi:hypothetical protein